MPSHQIVNIESNDSGNVPTHPTVKTVLLSPDSGILILLALLYLGTTFIAPFERPFSILDTSISHPNLPDIVPFWYVMAFAILAPLVLVLSITRSILRLCIVYQRYLLGILFTALFTEIIKVTAGRLRPDFLDRCKPNATLKCTGDTNKISDGRKSFFSGHSSLSFYVIGFLVWWMWEEGWSIIGIRKGKRSTTGIVMFFSIFPFALCSYVAISRTQQYIHHFEDVVVGSVFGLLMAYYVQVFFVRK